MESDQEDVGKIVHAIKALAEYGSVAQAAVPKLIELWGDSNYDVRRAANEALNKIGAPRPEDMEAIVELLNHEDSAVRAAAARALGQLGPQAAEAARALTGLLEDEADNVRAAAAMALGEIGPAANVAVPKLIELLADYYSGVRDVARQALGKIGAPRLEDEETIVELLGHADPAVRAAAAVALAQLYAPAGRCSQDLSNKLLQQAYGDPDTAVRENARVAWLAVSSCFLSRIVEEHVGYLSNPFPGFRKLGAETLGWIGAAASPIAVAPLLEVLNNDPDPEVRAAAASALGQILGQGDQGE